jgi:hypothetical protein
MFAATRYAVTSVGLINASVVDVGVIDHHAVLWCSTSSSLSSSQRTMPLPSLSFMPSVCPWRHLDLDEFWSAVAASRLCQREKWPDDLDEL